MVGNKKSEPYLFLDTFPDSSTASYPIKYNRLGDLLNYAKTYLPIGVAGGTANIQDHFEIYHVIGDPRLELWRHEPTSVGVKAAEFACDCSHEGTCTSTYFKTTEKRHHGNIECRC